MPSTELHDKTLPSNKNVSPPIAPKQTVTSPLSVTSPASARTNTHGSFERVPTAQDELPPEAPVQTTTTMSTIGPVHSVFTTNQKRFIVFMSSWAGFFSPVSGNIYFPALNSLARDLHVSNSIINLTLTSYMV